MARILASTKGSLWSRVAQAAVKRRIAEIPYETMAAGRIMETVWDIAFEELTQRGCGKSLAGDIATEVSDIFVLGWSR